MVESEPEEEPEAAPEPEPVVVKKVKAWDDTSSDEDEDEASSPVVVVKTATGQAVEDEADEEEEVAAVETEEEREERLAAQEEAATARRREKASAVLLRARAEQKKLEEETKLKFGDSSMRSPICCILGHVDTGKTKLLDYIRRTNVQGGEAGGITQQIGSTMFPMDAIRKQTRLVDKENKGKYDVPGLLIMDTPGHESFTNLRTRGSNLCDIAILVVDIMHGMEPQTLESLNLLLARNTPFVIALNKIDRLAGWKVCKNMPIRDALKKQSKETVRHYEDKVQECIAIFANEALNCQLYYRNKDIKKTYSIVPTSAHSGEGVPDLLLLLTQLTQKHMSKKLASSDELQATVLEVKVVEGLGTTIDVVLVNGWLHEGDKIVVCGMDGAIVTTIRALLTPQPLKELRVKGEYVHHKAIQAAQGVKISAVGLEKAIAGSELFVARSEEDVDELVELAQADLDSMVSNVDSSGKGVCVQASTLGSLEVRFILSILRVCCF